MTERYKDLIDRFTRWGVSSDMVSAALLLGSQARDDKKADEYSDADIMIIVDDPDYFISSDEWLNEIGIFFVSFVENTVGGLKERRVLFDGALDVDFILCPKDTIDSLAKSEVASILSNNCKILIDKIGFKDGIDSFDIGKQSFIMPTEQDFTNTVNDFWYHTVWTAKKLKRGELWTAKFCLDSYMKWKLMSIIECYTHIKHGFAHDTWYSGRFIEKWAEDWIINDLSLCFSHYDKNDMKSALFSTMKLFRSLAIETAEKLGYSYPTKADEYTTEWVTAALS